MGLAGCPRALTLGGNKGSGLNGAVELQCHQHLWLPAELLAEGTVGQFIPELTSLMQSSADCHHMLWEGMSRCRLEWSC